ncbi:Cut9-interacting protein scn1, partial [Massospora cicadina]
NPEFERSNLSSAPFSPPMLFVSISELVNMRSEKKLEKLLKTFSIDRILLESDCGSVSQVDEKLEIIAVKCSSLLNVTVQTFIEQVSKNSELFFMTNSN